MPVFTIGIEEEYQVIDPETRELRSHMGQLVADSNLFSQVRTEMHQSALEIGTGVCLNISEARKEVTDLRRLVSSLAADRNLKIAASGTHPFSRWRDQLITKQPHYDKIVYEMQDAARRNLIFGLHIHIGTDDRESAVQIMNAARRFLPFIFALSTNSPFWEGRNTGFKSYRAGVFTKFPRTGIPDEFKSLSELNRYISLLVKTGCIDDGRQIWWDVRLHPFHDTIEFRICDVPTKIDETVALAALIQAIVAKLHKLLSGGVAVDQLSRSLINENKWRASRYGLEGCMIDFGKETEISTIALIRELISFVDDVLDDLGSRDEIKYLEKIMAGGTGADRQLEVYRRTGDLKEVVDYVIKETNCFA